MTALNSDLEWDLYDPRDREALPSLLDRVRDLLARYVAFPSDAALTATTLWVLHAHAIEAFESTPRLAALSPEKGSGKTRLLEVLDGIVPAPMHAVNMSSAALFRSTDKTPRPTVLLDECDTYLAPHVAKQHEELRGFVNAGHRRGAVAYRCVGDPSRMQVQEFPAFCAIALAGIGNVPDTILDRSIRLAMKRRAPHEYVEPLRRRKFLPVATALRDQLAAWAAEHLDELANAEPEMPDGLTDRPADVWEPLLAVADVAGEPWATDARNAATDLNAERASADLSLGVSLLRDARNVFVDLDADRVSTARLLDLLHAMDDSPWGDLRGKPIDARFLSKMLRPYGIRPETIRIGEDTPKGYMREHFFDAWERYLPSETPQQGKQPQRNGDSVADVADVAEFRESERWEA